MLEAVLPASIAAFASIAVIVYTQYQSKRLTYFQTYFTKKVEAYSQFWDAVWAFQRSRSKEAAGEMTARFHAMALFAPDNIYEMGLEFLNNELEGNIVDEDDEDAASITNLTEAMRNDLENCKKMKF